MSRPWTLRRRLTLVVGLIILLVSAVIAVTVSVATRRVLIERVEEDLVAFSTRPDRPPGPGLGNPHPTTPRSSLLPWFSSMPTALSASHNQRGSRTIQTHFPTSAI